MKWNQACYVDGITAFLVPVEPITHLPQEAIQNQNLQTFKNKKINVIA